MRRHIEVLLALYFSKEYILNSKQTISNTIYMYIYYNLKRILQDYYNGRVITEIV